MVESRTSNEQPVAYARVVTNMAERTGAASAHSVVPATTPSNAAPAAHEMVVASGISLRLWRLYAQAWLVCLLFPILTLIQQRPPVFRLLLAVTGLVIFVTCYTAIMWSHPLRAEAHRRWSLGFALALLLGLVALVLMLSVAYGGAFLWLLVGVSAMAGVLLSPRSAFLAVMLLTLLTLALGRTMSMKFTTKVREAGGGPRRRASGGRLPKSLPRVTFHSCR